MYCSCGTYQSDFDRNIGHCVSCGRSNQGGYQDCNPRSYNYGQWVPSYERKRKCPGKYAGYNCTEMIGEFQSSCANCMY